MDKKFDLNSLFQSILVNTNSVMQKIGLFLCFLCSQVTYAQQAATIASFRKLGTTEQRLDFLADSNIVKMDKSTFEAILPIIEAKGDDQTAFYWHYQYMQFAQQFKGYAPEMSLKILERMTKVAEKGELEAELVVAQFCSTFNNFANKRLGEQQAYSVFLNCFEQMKRLGMDKFKRYGLVFTLQTIGGNFYALGDYEKTLECLLEGEKYAEVGSPHIKTMLLNTIECAYADTKNYPEAIAYAQKIIDLNKRSIYGTNQTWYGVFWQGLASLDIALYMFEMGNFKEGEKYAERGYELYKAQEDLNDLAKTVATFDALQVLIKIKLQLGKIDESENLLKKVEFLKSNIDFSHEVNYFKPLRFYNNYYKYYEIKKDYTNAFRYLKLANEMQDSLNRRNDKRKLWQIESRVKADNYIAQIKSAEEGRHFQKKLRNLAIITLLIFSVFAFAFYHRIKKDNKIIAQKTAMLEQSLGEKETLLKEIHHRVKNNLQIILGLFDKQARQITDEPTKKLLQAGQDRVFSIALVHQTLYQSENLNTIEIKSYLDLLTQNIEKSQKSELQDIKITLEVDDSVVDIDLAVPLGLILNELITNCYKYAFYDRTKGEILIQFRQEQKHFVFVVQDNGVGLPANLDFDKPLSVGINLVRGLVRQIKGHLEIVSNNTGTVFTVKCLKNT
jgi:two-component sensor histidine kinase